MVEISSPQMSGLVYVLSKVNFNLQRTLHKNNKLINNCPSHMINTSPGSHDKSPTCLSHDNVLDHSKQAQTNTTMTSLRQTSLFTLGITPYESSTDSELTPPMISSMTSPMTSSGTPCDPK